MGNECKPKLIQGAVFLLLVLMAFPLWAQVSYQYGWTTIPNSSLAHHSSALDALNGSGGDAAHNNAGAYFAAYGAVYNAWNSAWKIDLPGKHWLCPYGGGHADYAGNEIHCLDVGVNPPVYKLMTLPTIPTNYNSFSPVAGVPCASFATNTSGTTQNIAGDMGFAGPVANNQAYCAQLCTSNCKPNAVHTYGGLAYLPAQDKFLLLGGSPSWAGNQSNAVWTLNTASLSMSAPLAAAAVPWQRLTPAGLPGGGLFATTAELNGKVYVAGSGAIKLYDPAANTLTDYVADTYGIGGAYYSGTADTKRGLLYFAGSYVTGHVFRVKVGASPSFSELSSQIGGAGSGCDLAGIGAPGMAYDSYRDSILVWPNQGNTLYEYKITNESTLTGTCTPITVPGTAPNNAPNGTYGKLQYFAPPLNFLTACGGGAGGDFCAVLKLDEHTFTVKSAL